MSKPLSRTERRKQETRQEIFDAALACFAERGYHATGIADIAKRVGIAQGTFYLYFDSKRDLVNEIFDDFTGRFTTALADLPPETPTNLAEYQNQADQISRALMGVLRDAPQAARFWLLQAAAVDDEMAERVLRFYDTSDLVQRAYLQHGVDLGYFRPDLDVEHAARAINGMLLAAAYYNLRDPSAEAFDRLAETVRQIGYFGLVGPDGRDGSGA
ncbi:TetR/AcrR family transcriptional regulator [Segniliparus rugosus]|uniref:HTH tetR-type domain-containing protein n=1 Tax=Segniliparus rugosus (strain ATCC BAA-974 / DSM 45345 / CCUG 50838 / CIP 108380 / JCM 13579 / CDC 945) TaxID=679197 RepID=E5XUC0_SEGRC|nr:TetR/AcrR family transcriptional regulator [Segniliparus rugosus]EFV12061.1 hypothetical protein HMPREF9336_03092 [Segniliparus rugosus ATCC BAA-974]